MPVLPEGADPVAFTGWVTSWLSSDAMQRLVDASGWDVTTSSVDDRLDILVGCSEGWEFRRGAERHAITEKPAAVNGRILEEELVRRCAADLGLVSGMPVDGAFTHGGALGGTAKACRHRVALLHELAAQRSIDTLTVLTGHRPLEAREIADADALGWGTITLESEAAVCAAREVFDLGATPDDEVLHPGHGLPVDAPATAPTASEYQRRTAWFVRHWEAPRCVDVIAAPSTAPMARRANTPDQLLFWADRRALTADARILLVTTDVYAPFQQLQALRILGQRRGCRVVTTGTSWTPSGPFRAAGYLQELRSTLLAAQQLRDSFRSA